LEVEVDHRPQDVSDPRAIFLFGLDQPFGEFDQDIDAERRAVYPWASDNEQAQILKVSRTRGRGTDAGLLIENPLKLDTKYCLLDATGEHVPSQADYLLRSGESVDNIVQLGAQTLVPEHGELVEPRVVDEAGIAQPVDRELGVVRIRDDGSNHANLQYTNTGVVSPRLRSGKDQAEWDRRTSAPASGPVVSWRRVFFVAGSNLEKYSLTAASDSARVISLRSLSHEKGLEKAWLARPTTEKSVKMRMVATMIGEVRETAKLPLYFMTRLTQHQWHM
jgi:hypothetical protein